jgi:hypothetical protein
MLEEMPPTLDRLSSLRNEITDLHKLNTTFREKRKHSPIEQSAAELRAQRLVEIKQELSKLLTRPDSTAWW